MLFSSGPWRNRLERHSSECGSQKLIKKIYGRYKMFDLASSRFMKCGLTCDRHSPSSSPTRSSHYLIQATSCWQSPNFPPQGRGPGTTFCCSWRELVKPDLSRKESVIQLVNFSVDNSCGCTITINPSCYLRCLICADASRTPMNPTAFSTT